MEEALAVVFDADGVGTVILIKGVDGIGRVGDWVESIGVIKGWGSSDDQVAVLVEGVAA